MVTEIAIAVASAIAVVAALILGVQLRSKPKCPECGKRSIEQIDNGVFYDPAPERELCCCGNCGAELVRTAGKWVRRVDWHNGEDQKLWDDLRRA